MSSLQQQCVKTPFSEVNFNAATIIIEGAQRRGTMFSPWRVHAGSTTYKNDTKALRRRERSGGSSPPSTSPQRTFVLDVIQFHHELVHSFSPYLLSSPSTPGRLPHTRNDIQSSPPPPGLELDSDAFAQRFRGWGKGQEATKLCR